MTLKQNKRGRWNSLNSLTKALWSASAALGGWVVEHYGVLTNFTITACLQCLTIVPLFLVWRLEPPEIDGVVRDNQKDDHVNTQVFAS